MRPAYAACICDPHVRPAVRPACAPACARCSCRREENRREDGQRTETTSVSAKSYGLYARAKAEILMTRDELEARVWRYAPDLRGPGAGKAMDAILRAADAFAVTEAGR